MLCTSLEVLPAGCTSADSPEETVKSKVSKQGHCLGTSLIRQTENTTQYLKRALLFGVPPAEPAGPGLSSCGCGFPAQLLLPPFPERSLRT